MNLTKKYSKLKNFISEYYWITIIPLMIWALFNTLAEKEGINDNLTITYGVVYDSKPIYKKYSKRNYEYKFYFKGIKYTGTSPAYNSENVKIGNFYKVEFSNGNPKSNRMIFDLEYRQKLITDSIGKIIDTTYISIKKEVINTTKKQIEKYKFELDTTKT